MSKAIEILLMDRYQISNPKIVTTEMFNEAIAEIEQMEARIIELEAQKAKSCDGCQYELNIYHMTDSISGCDMCSRQAIDRYEPKDNA